MISGATDPAIHLRSGLMPRENISSFPDIQHLGVWYMKKLAIMAAVLLLPGGVVFGANSGGSPIVGGGTGILTVPTARTMGTGALDLGFYFIGPKTFAVSGGFGLMNELDLSIGFELDDNNVQDPFLHIRSKYRFAGSDANGWAFGADFGHALGEGGGKQSHFTIYLVNSFYQASWQFTWGFGYTFGSKDNINFMVGVSREVVQNLYVEVDYSNYSYRYFDGGHLSEHRGIGNAALRLHLLDGKLRLTLGLFDAFDANREIGLGVAFKAKF
jgi:hypothetical protein